MTEVELDLMVIADEVLNDPRLMEELNSVADDSFQIVDDQLAVDVTMIAPIILAAGLRSLANHGFINLNEPETPK